MRILFIFLLYLFIYPKLALSEDTIVSHGLAMHGDLKYNKDFAHFEYVDPQAPKGGLVRLGARGTYDSFNSFIIIINKYATGINIPYPDLATRRNSLFIICNKSFINLVGSSYSSCFLLFFCDW